MLLQQNSWVLPTWKFLHLAAPQYWWQNCLPEVYHCTPPCSFHSWLLQLSEKKLHWINWDMDDIHWTVLQMALASFHPNDQCCLILFINDKLPLCVSKAHPHIGSPLCPSCQREPENEWHFLECQEQDHQALFMELKRALTQLTQKLQLHLACSCLYG